MKAKYAKCIGGPFDGVMKIYHDDSQFMYYRHDPNPAKVTASTPLSSIMREVSKYIVSRIDVTTPKYSFVVLVHESLTMQEALEQLILFYNPPIPTK